MSTVVATLEQELQDARRRVRQLEQRLAEQRSVTQSREDMLAYVVNHAPIVLWSVDADGAFTLSAGSGLSALGLRPNEVVGKSVFALYADYPQVLDEIRQALRGFGGMYLNQVGGRWFESWIAPLTDADGRVTGAVGVSTDVTARQCAEASQRAFHDRFQHVFQSSPMGIFVTDFETGRIQDANPAFCRLLGYRRDELIGRTSLELGYWSDSTTRYTMLGGPFQPRKIARGEHRVQTRTGRIRTIRFAAEHLEIDGRPCLLNIVQDATQQKRWETALKRSQQRYRQLAEFAPVGIFRATRSAGWTYANEHLARLWGCQRRQLKGDWWLTAVVDDDRPNLAAAYRRAVDAVIPLSIEFRVQTAGSGARWVLLQMEPHVDRGAFLGTAVDVTQRRQTEFELARLNAELESEVDHRTKLLMRANELLQEQIAARLRAIEQLEASQERWRSLVQTAPDMIIQLNRDRTIEFVNHTVPNARYSPEELTGMNVLAVIPPDDAARLERDLDRVFLHGESISHETRVPDKSGEIRWYESRIAPILSNGRVTGATVVCREVTDIKRAADQLRQTQDRLLHLARVGSVGEMTAALAHELNQPLAAIANYVRGSLIRLKGEGVVTAEILDTLQEAVDEAHRASEVIRRLRQFLQRQEFERKPADLNGLVQEAIRLAEPAFRRHEVLARSEFAESLPAVYGDRVQLIQVVLNLLLNAAEALSERCDAAREVLVETFNAGGGQIGVRVTDTGPGLPAHLGSAIFDPFVTTKAGGLGIGLSISRTIVEAHQGQLRCESRQPACGARFEVLLPMHEGKETA